MTEPKDLPRGDWVRCRGCGDFFPRPADLDPWEAATHCDAPACRKARAALLKGRP